MYENKQLPYQEVDTEQYDPVFQVAGEQDLLNLAC
jgi:hypothetical protein